MRSELIPTHGPRRHRALALTIVEDVAAKIRDGTCAAGAKLPTEPELMKTFDVSRAVVREALSRLQALTLVETRHGVGTFVLPSAKARAPALPKATAHTIREVLEMLEFRSSLETDAVALAAARRTSRKLAEIQRTLAELDRDLEAGRDAKELDLELHVVIAEASGNHYYGEALRRLGTAAIPRTRIDTARLSAQPAGAYLHRVNYEHHGIFDAIARKDPEAARAAMRLHLANSMQRLRQASGGAPGVAD